MPSDAARSVRADRRKKVGLTAAQAERLRSEAHASSLTESAYIVKVLCDAWRAADKGQAPVLHAGFRPDQPIELKAGDPRKRISFTPLEQAVVDAKARACGMTAAKYLHDVVVASWGEGKTPKPTRNSGQHELAAQLNALAWHVAKLGTNVNQLAKQANAGMVQVSRAEIQYLMNQQQTLLSQVTAVVEQVIA